MMAEEGSRPKSVTTSAEAASGAESGNTLLPMLIAGLVLIVIGAIAVMFFV
jgi:hypothetical protein